MTILTKLLGRWADGVLQLGINSLTCELDAARQEITAREGRANRLLDALTKSNAALAAEQQMRADDHQSYKRLAAALKESYSSHIGRLETDLHRAECEARRAALLADRINQLEHELIAAKAESPIARRVRQGAGIFPTPGDPGMAVYPADSTVTP